jgi:glucose-6-phosphate 1-epimerase
MKIERVTWQQAADQLSTIRRQVFVIEQQVDEALEWDGQDESANHLLALSEEGIAIGCARLLADGHLGRMAVLADQRRRGVGSALLNAAIKWAEALAMRELWLDAQTHAIGFYQRHGWQTEGEIFIDAGIPHRRMRRSISECGE